MKLKLNIAFWICICYFLLSKELELEFVIDLEFKF